MISIIWRAGAATRQEVLIIVSGRVVYVLVNWNDVDVLQSDIDSKSRVPEPEKVAELF